MSKKPAIRTSPTIHVSNEDALRLHATGRPSKLEITPTKALATQSDLLLACSLGVAAPCLHIAKNPAYARPLPCLTREKWISSMTARCRRMWPWMRN
ncbi:MAG: hypothetical protein QF386_00810 [Alphaproteobacteria bacterium]|jgi:malic enzyme|nr:hypothetical protein [Alphaproteobacteria bacterium]MDP6661111.1 hypothetical protein [Alphaproteobacteria bacterium]MDP6780853.1 hypothetical protein [Alphaproteobacteria bacterium]MDP7044156.1 hypothetical protein [Alphaproteobacteria bacterium]